MAVSNPTLCSVPHVTNSFSLGLGWDFAKNQISTSNISCIYVFLSSLFGILKKMKIEVRIKNFVKKMFEIIFWGDFGEYPEPKNGGQFFKFL